MANTPGYNIRLTIKIAEDKNGHRRATYWSMACMRNLPIAIAKAEKFLANGEANAA